MSSVLSPDSPEKLSPCADQHSGEAKSPCNESGLALAAPKLGPCGEPCDTPCDEPCEKTGSALSRMLQKSFFNALDLCFDDVKQEPKRILMIGGCRQREFAQHIALLLPAADIVLVDPDPEEARKAKEEICCRFAFISCPLEQLPFEDDTFDLTFAHNFFEFSTEWEKALAEVGRVTSRNLMLSTHRQQVWKVARHWPGLPEAVASTGVTLPETLPSKFDFLTQMFLYSKVKSKFTPFPWNIFMATMKPNRETRLTLEN